MAVYPATKMSNFAYFAYFYSPNPSCSILTLLSPDYTLQIFCIFLPKNLEKPESSSYLCTAKRKKRKNFDARPFGVFTEAVQRPSNGCSKT